ncbi:DUF4394 domain-containing protein [Chitinimonas sp. BJYL2]|uniref:DUF4394 domain-containing protein n=1 Tax=Chitinimonas sp. BJYL2 TaxID=2976696 RepID=UPI0022B52614|nr:DUF4394 domain-containing protein [Chitinimonas sp. BJYL2]
MNRLIPLLALGLLTACATVPTQTPRPETAWALTASGKLLRMNAGVPGKIEQSLTISGLANGEQLLGIDFRSTNEKLYGLASSGRLYTVDLGSGQATTVTAGNATLPAAGEWGVDFNPVVDRLRVVNHQGVNLRLHPDTGAQVDGDPAAEGVQQDARLAYADSDTAAGKVPSIAGAAYTYSKVSKTGTTNFAIDTAAAALVTQGTREGVQPAVGPNTGKLFTVGKLGMQPEGPLGFDISWKDNAAFASFRTAGQAAAGLYLIDLNTGAATLLGNIGSQETVIGLAIAPSW